VPTQAFWIRTAGGIPYEVSNVALVTGGDAVAFVKASRRIVEAPPIAVAKVLRTDSALVGILEFFLLLLSIATFLVLRFLGIPSFLAERNLGWGHPLVGKRVLLAFG
jgi:hypothetical protein